MIDDMKTYVGCKMVNATPMTDQEFCRKVRDIPEIAEWDDPRNGYLVEYKDGYKSWSPEVTFEEAYQISEGLSGRVALSLIKQFGLAGRREIGDDNDPDTVMAIFYCKEDGKFHSYNYYYKGSIFTPNETDFLATDWKVFNNNF